eukprot:scaffold133349_cov90-Phaeocystis_antarctica.AAC.2
MVTRTEGGLISTSMATRRSASGSLAAAGRVRWRTWRRQRTRSSCETLACHERSMTLVPATVDDVCACARPVDGILPAVLVDALGETPLHALVGPVAVVVGGQQPPGREVVEGRPPPLALDDHLHERGGRAASQHELTQLQ